MSGALKFTLIGLGLLAALLIISQLVMGLLILNGASGGLRVAHQHSGYLTVAVTLLYIGLSLTVVASAPGRERPRS